MSSHGPFGSNTDGDAGAFAVPDNLDWESVGFADEANGTRPAAPAAPAQPAPAPAAPPAPAPAAPAARPVLPAQPATQQPAHRPAPASVQPPAPMPTAPTPTYAPPAPAPAPVPSAPVYPPAPQQPAPMPPAPAPAPAYVSPPAPPAPAQTPAQAQSAPGYTHATTAELEDLAEPEWARIGPVEISEADLTFTGDDESLPSVGVPVQSVPTPVEGTTAAGKRKKGRAPKPAGPTRNPAREQKKNQYAGGRWTIKAIRVAVFFVAALLMAGGLKNVIVGDQTATPAELAAAVKTELGYTGFPTAAAEAFAVRFIREYLTYDVAGDTAARDARLAVYSPAAANSEWGWEGEGKQQVITGPYVAAPTKPEDKHYATVTVTAQVDSGQWLAVAVPVYASETGALAIAGPPAFVTQPALATSPGRDQSFDEDDETADVLSTEVLPGFLSAWAASNPTELDRYITPDATIAARTGLAGAVTFAEVGTVVIPVGGDTRTGTVEVTWSAAKSGTFRQTYNLTVVKNADGRWFVKDITGGAFSSDSDTPVTPADTTAASPGGAVITETE